MQRIAVVFRQLSNNFGKEVVAAAKWQYILNIGMGIFAAVYMLALGRFLGVGTFGSYAISLAVPSVIFCLFDARLQEVCVYFHSSENKYRNENIISVFALDVILRISAFFVSILAGFLLNKFGYFSIDPYLVFLCSFLTLFCKFLSTPSMGVLRNHGKIHVFSVAQVCDWGFRLIALIVLYFSGNMTLQSVIISQIIIGLVFNLIVVFRALNILSNLNDINLLNSLINIVPMCSQNSRLIFGSLAISIMDSVVKELDVLIGGAFLTESEVGIYKMAKNLSGITWRLVDPVYILILPRLSALSASKDFQKLKMLTRQLTVGLAVAAVPLYFASVVCVFWLGPFILGIDYAMSISIFPYASAWILVALPLVWTHSMSISAGRADIQMLGGIFGNGLGLAALWIGSKYFGLTGAALGLSVAYCLPFVFSLILLRRSGIVKW